MARIAGLVVGVEHAQALVVAGREGADDGQPLVEQPHVQARAPARGRRRARRRPAAPSTRSTCARSVTGSQLVFAMRTPKPSSLARRSMPCASCAKNGFTGSGTTSARTFVARSRSALATPFGRYPSALTDACTRARVSGATSALAADHVGHGRLRDARVPGDVDDRDVGHLTGLSAGAGLRSGSWRTGRCTPRASGTGPRARSRRRRRARPPGGPGPARSTSATSWPSPTAEKCHDDVRGVDG